MVNGFRCYRALESVSIASALSTALAIYPCQIRVHQRWQSKLQLPTARKKEWRPATADSSPYAVTCQHCDTHYFSRTRTRNLPIVGWLSVRRATSSATDSHCIVTLALVTVQRLHFLGDEKTLRKFEGCLSDTKTADTSFWNVENYRATVASRTVAVRSCWSQARLWQRPFLRYW